MLQSGPEEHLIVGGITLPERRNLHMSNVEVEIKRGGEKMTVDFSDIKAGDYIVALGIYAADDAHYSGDADYDGYLFFADDGDGYFPEDID